MLFSECSVITTGSYQTELSGYAGLTTNTRPTSLGRRARESGGLTLRWEEHKSGPGMKNAGVPLAQAASLGGGRVRRVADRFDLNEAVGSLVHKGARIPCKMIDISLTGCCVRTPEPFAAGALETVRVVFPIYEMVLSIWGLTQWVRGEQLLGIHFRHPNPQSKNQLAALLTCLVDKSAAEVVKKAMAEIAANPGENPILQLEHPPAPPPTVEDEPELEPLEILEGYAAPQVQAPPAPVRPVLRSEEKVLSMEVGESPATLTLLGDAGALGGDVVDLSLTGCLMRLFHPKALRLKVQAEVSFHMQGLPFRLAGITREMHDKRTVEIQFSQMSMRSRDDLNQVILELIERSDRKKLAS